MKVAFLYYSKNIASTVLDYILSFFRHTFFRHRRDHMNLKILTILLLTYKHRVFQNAF